MNNNENLNQQPINQEVNSMNTTNLNGNIVNQPIMNSVQPVVNNTQSVTQPVVNASQPVVSNSVPVTSNVQPSQQVPIQQQRVQLVNDKPAIQAVVPNNNMVAKPTTSEVSEDENVEMLEDENSSGGTSEQSNLSNNKGSKWKTLFLILLFGGLFAVIVFLPDISSYIQTQKYLKTQSEEIITTGTLKCEFENSAEELDYNYLLDFVFADSRLTKLTYVTEIRGDINLDATKLELLKTECEQLMLNSKQLGGISVSCGLNGSVLRKKQVLNYSAIDVDEAMSAYMEAGGIYPDYENGQSIDDIEKEMNASGYSCKRVK